MVSVQPAGSHRQPEIDRRRGAMLCSPALDLRLPRFNFKAADIGAYSTVRYLGVLDNTVNTLREENVWYQDIDTDKRRKTRRPPAFPAAWERHAWLPPAGERTLASDAAVHPEYQLGGTGQSDCWRRRAERAA